MSRRKDDGPYYGEYIEAYKHRALRTERGGDGLIGKVVYMDFDGELNAINIYSDEYVRELNVQEVVTLKLQGVTAEAWRVESLTRMPF